MKAFNCNKTVHKELENLPNNLKTNSSIKSWTNSLTKSTL